MPYIYPKSDNEQKVLSRCHVTLRGIWACLFLKKVVLL